MSNVGIATEDAAGRRTPTQILFDEHQQEIYRGTDRLFIGLMLLQWLAGIVAALWISPRAWAGSTSITHPHVWTAIFLGGAIASLPVYFALTSPGASVTRHVVAVSQMLFSALLIHLSGGRIETHFHVFGSLAFLAFYRDWRVLVTATVVVLIDHLTRGSLWPQSTYGVLTANVWRSVEHAGWVVFEDIFLGWACVRNVREMWNIAEQRAQLEATNAIIRATQEDLRHAKDAAESANRAKSDFVAHMSHEIRTPLNGVLGMIDLLRNTEMNDLQQRYARLARESSDSLLRVINDILDFSKIEAGKVEIEATQFDFHSLVEDLTELLGPIAAKKNLTLACFIRPQVPRPVIGDPNRIRQVLTNLINNALKFTARGHVSIRASLERREGDSLMVRVQVEDTGIGIPAERLDRLFKSFSQVDRSTTRKFGGTGLGLAICKPLVELMGGQIGVSSEEARGTIFWFTLKLTASVAPESFSKITQLAPQLSLSQSDLSASAATPVAKRPAPLQSPLQSARAELQGLHFLIAEDNEMNQFVTGEMLRSLGCTCDIVDDGVLAVEAVQHRPYDMVLMDCQMPSMDGLEAARRIRAGEAAIVGSRRIPIIALTAEAMSGDRDRCLAAGMDSYVTKPIDAAKLVAAIRSLATNAIPAPAPNAA